MRFQNYAAPIISKLGTDVFAKPSREIPTAGPQDSADRHEIRRRI